MKINLSEIQIAWLAGLFEAEASFGLDKRSKQPYKNSTAPAMPFIKIAMTDQHIIARVAALVNQLYFSPSGLTITNKKVLICHIGDRKTVAYLLARLFPYMGKRRQDIIEQCLIELSHYDVWIKSKVKLQK